MALPTFTPAATRRLLLAAAGLAASTAAAACFTGSQGTPSGERPPEEAVNAPPPTPTPRLRAPLTYVAVGASDSIGVGVDDPTRESWVALLATRLPQPVRLVNLGIPGIKLREAIEVELPPALDANPHLVTVWLAVNDVLGAVALAQYRADLSRLLATLRSQRGTVTAVANIPKAPERSAYLGLAGNERNTLVAQWNAAIGAVVQEQGAVLVDLFSRWPLREHPEYIGPDGLHPTVVGYRTLAETFLDVLRAERIV